MSKLCVSQRPHIQDGPWSWLVCFAAMMSWMAAVGFVFSFGVFFPVLMEFFDEDRERTAWIGSLAIAVVFFTGPVSGFFVNKFGCRLTNLVGTLICATGLATASLAEGLVTLYISHSILFGIGTSFVFNASLVIVSNYFSKRRSLALALVTAGSGLGVLVQGPLLQALLKNYGWKTTYRIMAGVVFGMCFLGITYDPNAKSEEEKNNLENFEQFSSSVSDIQPRTRRLVKRGKCLDVSVWKIPAFVAITLSCAVTQVGHYVPQIHLVQFCESLGITADKASKLYIYFGLSSAIARIPVGRICDIPGINLFYVYQSVEFVIGLSTILITQATGYTAMIVFMVIYGFCDGAFVTTLNVLLMACVDGIKRPAALGWQMQVASIFMASGPPIAGLMADRLGSYDGAFYMAGSAVMVGAAIPFILHITKRGETGVRLEVKTDNKDDDITSCFENTAANLNVEEGGLGTPCDDVTRSVIEAPPRVSKSELSCTKADRFIGKESVKDASVNYSPEDDQLNVCHSILDGVVNESFTISDEAISNNTEMRQTDLQADIEVNLNSPFSPSVADNEQETGEELEYDTKL